MSANRLFLITVSIFVFLAVLHKSDGAIYRLITETLQNNVAGEPVTHERTNWDFDPEVSKQRRALFYEKNGYRGAKFIESIGVGIDGKEDERRQEQEIRDAGRLNGEHYRNFP